MIRMGGDDRFHIVDSFEKLFAESGSFALIPAISGSDFCRSGRTNDDRKGGLITFGHGLR